MTAAQEALEKSREEPDRATRGFDDTGRLETPVLSFAIPKAGASGDEYETLTLPTASFRDRRRPRLATLSLEFECELKEKRLSCFSRARGMVMRIRKNSGSHGGKRRRMVIVFRGTKRPFGEVRVDGELLMAIPPMEGPAGRWAEVAVERPLFRALSDLWGKLWRPREFVLTERQADRIREIFERSDHESARRRNKGTVKETTFSR